MDLAQAFILNAGWLFFSFWGMVMAVISAVAFGPDMRRAGQRLELQTKVIQKLSGYHLVKSCLGFFGRFVRVSVALLRTLNPAC